MAQELEHKYLVRSEDFRSAATEVIDIDQGYLHRGLPTVRVRRWADRGFLTIKGPSNASGLARAEYEYEIPLTEALELLALCGERRLTKQRYIVPYAGHRWEVDVFSGRHEGLILAELEVASAEERYELPDWLGEEVTGDPHYYNSTLASEQ